MGCYLNKKRRIKKKIRRIANNINEYFEIDREQAMKMKPRIYR